MGAAKRKRANLDIQYNPLQQNTRVMCSEKGTHVEVTTKEFFLKEGIERGGEHLCGWQLLSPLFGFLSGWSSPSVIQKGNKINQNKNLKECVSCTQIYKKGGLKVQTRT